MVTWYPDFCPAGSCAIELNKLPNGFTDWTGPKSIIRLCPHHQNVKTVNGLDDARIFRAIIQSSRVKENARKTVKRELALDRKHPGIPYTVEPDGNFTLRTDTESLAWTREDGTPGPLPTITTEDRLRAKTEGEAAADGTVRSIGTSTVTVE